MWTRLRPRPLALLLLLSGVLATGCQTRRDGPWVEVPETPGGTVVDPGRAGYDTCPGQMSASGSRGLVFICIGGLGGLVAWSWLRARGFLRQAASEQSIDPVGPLRAGPFALVGTVEVESGDNPVTIWIEQVGRESRHKNRWSHSWKETSRRIDVHPFVVRRDDGQTVKVEPGTRVVLHDTLSRFEYGGPHSTRTRIAEVKPGDRVYVTGKLVDVGVHGGGGVYREALRMPRLIPASTGPMVLSTEAPGGTARRLGRLQRWCSIAVGIVLASQLVAVISPYWVQQLFGTTTVGTIQRVRTYETWHKPKNSSGYWTTHTEAQVSWADDQLANFRVTSDLFTCAARGGCDRVVVRSARLAGFTTSQLGGRPTLGSNRALVLFFVSAGALIAWLAVLLGARPWWLRRKVVDRGSGRLSGTTTSVKDAVPPTEPR